MVRRGGRVARFAPDFAPFAGAGRQLAELHLNYEKLDPYPLQFVETPNVPLNYVVSDKMNLDSARRSIRVNDTLIVAGISPAVFGARNSRSGSQGCPHAIW